ncbi:MAG: ATP-binding cassette domain-containing protein [Pseudoxanthomonas sp.]
MTDTPVAAPLIELDRATVIRGDTHALDDLSLRIELGQHTALLGANGCGKSTFIKLINRELYPLAREGEAPVRLMGQARWRTQTLRAQLGVVTSDLTADLQSMPSLTVEDAVVTGFFASFALPIDEDVTAAQRARARQTLDQVGALALAERQVGALSTGQMRRVLIARAMVHGPKALLLDEPTAGLDLIAQRDFTVLMSQLARDGITLVLVTHHIEEIVPEIDRIVLLREGQVLADGTRAAVLTDDLLSQAYGGALKVRYDNGRYFASS